MIEGVSVRLAGIDAPELDHWWGEKSKAAMEALCNGQTITARLEPEISYDRVVATCFLPDGRDLGAELVKQGLALDWPKFSGGRYAHLEPEGVRTKLSAAAARQRGHMKVFHSAKTVKISTGFVSEAVAIAHIPKKCPCCDSPMVLRKNRKTGCSFYGCSAFPQCRGTVEVKAGKARVIK